MASSLIIDMFVSADGWAGSDGLPAYFGYLGPDLQEWIMAELAAPQIVIMGRRTYQFMAELPEQAHGKSWPRTAELDKVVFSRTLDHATWPNTRICSKDAVDEIQRMKAGGSIPLRTWGSLSLARQLIRAGLADRLRLMTFPLIAGPSGRDAALADMPSADLELAGHQVLDDRVLLVEYRPTGKDIPRT
jgi:dihydrofolate reductase